MVILHQHGVVMDVCALFPSVLAVWGVGGRGGGRQAAHQERGAALRALGRGQRVLERAAGEGLCQVSQGPGFPYIHIPHSTPSCMVTVHSECQCAF